MVKIAFIGLGVMGYPQAGHLAAKGHELRVFNRTKKKAEAWVKQHGGSAHDTPRDAAQGAEIVFTMVGDDNDIRSVVYGDEGVLGALDKRAILVDHTTASADIARELDLATREKGALFMDAPVSGGQAGAENGILTIMCGGNEETFARAEPIMQAYGRTITHMGPVGAGQLTKMVNQICIAGVVQGLAEAVNFALAARLDTDRVLATISKGAAQSWQMENRWKTMVEGKFDFGFAVDWMRKDLRIAIEEARHNGAPLPIIAAVDQLYRMVQQQGGSRYDTSSLIVNLRKP
ncbi:3-hydroxyisobutyrate dehydrogenase/2-hydroxy-3-oxopropionate reductase [Arboricoccus pini]|uniref:3-hydroxyisobutyrate dehydrogenase/2-hydroxy-3-oxopropionate reductase n=1 Tax=Arboricoccus pini TaxID=1963835 RepID=A0A212R339_9PROT|nr:NAD(P)-dependent oxidoreductase [Arboricoccus pini]SNB66407.1 3-hydroxyisobutyrate dehydrogenase/2-hydroxy-3-oxopropionate reductase [Arboricoccus pini]